MALSQLLASICLTLLAYGALKLFRFLYSEFITSPLRYLPGPKSSSIIYGNLKDIYQAENSVLHEKWVAEYGNTIKYKGLAGMNRLFTMDTKAINHVLMNNNIYQKPSAVRYNLGRILGHGLLIVEDDKHKQQRKIMNPAFGAAQIRDLTEIFVEKSILLRNIWASEIAKEGENELNEAFSKIFSAGTKFSILPFIRAMFPILRFIPLERDAEAKSARNTMDRIGNELLRNSKAAIFDANGTEVEKSSLRGRDLLSLLIRANLAKDLPESQRMNDEDVLAQVPTFLVAGHETTSTATTWALYALTQSPDVQVKLREELLKVSTDNPTMDELNGLPYLDAVVRETLRVHAPVASTIRVAVKDDILPLSTPVVCTNGKTEHYLRVKKGQTIFVPILALNRAKRIWGEDSFEFKPERWFSVPEAASSVPGVWGNLLTFLGGPRACIGYRFSVVEMKALLFTLVRAFEFELAVPPEDIGKKTAIVQRPIVKSEPGNNHMPLLIRPFHRS